MCRTLLISSYGSRPPSPRSKAQLGKVSSTAVTCTLMTRQGAPYNNSMCLLYCLLGKTVHQKNFLSVLYALRRRRRVIDAAADVFFRCDDVLFAHSGPIPTLWHVTIPLTFIVCPLVRVILTNPHYTLCNLWADKSCCMGPADNTRMSQGAEGPGLQGYRACQRDLPKHKQHGGFAIGPLVTTCYICHGHYFISQNASLKRLSVQRFIFKRYRHRPSWYLQVI